MCLPYRKGEDEPEVLPMDTVIDAVSRPENYGRPMFDKETEKAIREYQKSHA